jgi:hypothetical protein
MVFVGAKVEGAAQLRRTLKRAGDDLSDFSALNRAAAVTVANRARQKAPVGPEFGGHIRDTIRSSGTKRAAIVRAGNNRKMPYAPSLHWGWPARGQAAQPWVSDAAQETEPQWVETYWAGLNQIINKVKGV